MEDNKKLDIDVNEAVEYSEEEMKKLRDENLEGVAGGTQRLKSFSTPGPDKYAN